MSNDPNFNIAQSPTQPLSNTPPAPAPNATPFDTHLVDDTDAPRYTQPLPNSTVATGSVPVQIPRLPSQVMPNTDPATPNYFTPTPSGPLPNSTPITVPTVVTSNQASQTTPPHPPLQSPTAHLPASRVPMTTLLGLAAVGGAILVAFGSTLVRRAVPPTPTTSTTIVETQRRNPNNSSAPTIIMKPSTGSSNNVLSNDADNPSNESDGIIIVPSIEESTSSRSSSVIREPADESPRHSSSSSDSNSSGRDEENDDSVDSSTNGERVARVPSTIVENNDSNSTSNFSNDAERETTSDRDDAERPSRISSEDSARSSSRYVERRREYSIQPPREFRLTQSGRRTIWKGSGGAQILVEVAKNDGQSPRAGWESLDRSLSKKYGRAYTSRGIRETTVNGRRAAVWEFDLRQKNGTTVRKMDVAVVDKNNGYAVLVSAPVENFERMRPTFDRVVNSFQVGESTTRGRDSDSDDSPEGF